MTRLVQLEAMLWCRTKEEGKDDEDEEEVEEEDQDNPDVDEKEYLRQINKQGKVS